MAKIQGKYVAQITIRFNADMSEPERVTIEEAKENLKGLSNAIKAVIYDEILGEENGSVEINELERGFRIYDGIDEIERGLRISEI